MLDTKEKWVRGVRQSMTTEKCMTKICGPKLPTIKEMGCANPTQLINVEGNWQNAFPSNNPETLPHERRTKEEADEHIAKKKPKRNAGMENIQGNCTMRGIPAPVFRKEKAA